MKYIENVKVAMKEVYEKPSYIGLTLLVVGVVIFTFNALITNYKVLFSNFSIKLLFALLAGTYNSMATIPFVLLIVMSILAGIILSMSIFLTRRQVSVGAAASSSSVFVSLIAPACPSCAIGFVSFIGLGGFLAVLPFKGLELGVAGLSLLTVSLVFLSGKIATKTCKIK